MGFQLFDTAIGTCAIAWRGDLVTAVQLPERDEAATRARMRKRGGDACEETPPPHVQHAIDRIAALFRGEPQDLSDIPLALDDVPPFDRRVYEIARTVPSGSTCSYGDIASRLGAPGAARAVGQALGRNPFVIIVPCHRVLAAGGAIGGFSAAGGASTKQRLLEIERRSMKLF
jgi:methylated-DNA-[protein]-cysteine S-methyltransferase